MKDTRLVRFGVAVCASIVIGACLPGLAGAQQQPSGAIEPVGVQAPGPASPVQLPRTGNPDADTNGGLPGGLLGGGAVLALLVFRRDWVKRTLRRRRH